jgi:hypothetical protein
MKSLIILLCFGFSIQSNAQTSFPDKCLGVWSGMMHIYNNETLKDSVQVKFTVAKTSDVNGWIWKTEYLSTKMPVIKDYFLRLKDKEKNVYVIDEGEGLELTAYLFKNKLYSVFETHEILLTSSYELVGNRLIFEVTSGKKLSGVGKEVTNYSVTNLQRVVLRKIEK